MRSPGGRRIHRHALTIVSPMVIPGYDVTCLTSSQHRRDISQMAWQETLRRPSSARGCRTVHGSHDDNRIAPVGIGSGGVATSKPPTTKISGSRVRRLEQSSGVVHRSSLSSHSHAGLVAF